jgi:hypothetical protein
MATPKWAVGMRVLAPGFYIDAQNQVHVDEPAVAHAAGLPYTEQTQAIIHAIAKEVFSRLPGGARFDHVDDVERYDDADT